MEVLVKECDSGKFIKDIESLYEILGVYKVNKQIQPQYIKFKLKRRKIQVYCHMSYTDEDEKIYDWIQKEYKI